MYVFVSHSRENSSLAFRLCDELSKRGVQTWLDVRDLEPGAEWSRGVIKAIRGASGFVFLIGPPASSDRYQSFELQQIVESELYLDPSKPLIPVLIGDPDLPGFLKTRRTVRLNNTAGALDEVADVIVKTLADPSISVDPSKLELGRRARVKALESLREYSRTLAEEDLRRSGVRVQE